MEITIALNEQKQQLLRAICDAALKQQGLQMLQACGIILNEIEMAKKNETGIARKVQSNGGERIRYEHSELSSDH